jgi:hypothetical protein
MDRREALITGVVLAVTCALITVIVAGGRRAGDDVATVDEDRGGSVTEPRSGSDDVDPDDVDPDDVDPDVADQELDAFVAEAVAFIEATRGREFITEPEVVALTDAEFVDRIDEDFTKEFDEDPESVAMYNAAYRATGLIGSGDDIDDIYRDFGAAGVLGFYDPTTDELVVRQVLTRSTIVHELTHAFDDQHFDLDRPEYDDLTDEVPWAFRAVAEGSATWVESQWQDGLSPSERSALLEEELGFGDPSIFGRFELSFLIYELSPYEYGEPFVEHLVDEGGQSALDDVLEEPPVTSEQVMIPPRFDEAEGATPVPAPPADSDVLFEGAGGSALIVALFQGNGVSESVEWAGDQMTVWVDGDRSCVRWDILAETDAGRDELRSGLEAWAGRVGGATVTDLGGLATRVDRCA